MPISNLKKVLAPIEIKQTTLLKFCPSLTAFPEDNLLAKLEARDRLASQGEYTIELVDGNTIEIVEKHCLHCGLRLRNNGFWEKQPVLDHGLGRVRLRVHRKHCKRCGEVKLDLSCLAPRNGHYHENYKRRARQHYEEGLMPAQVRRALGIDLEVRPALSTIVNWTEEPAEDLHAMLVETPVPSSGSWAYDEIFLKIKGERKYFLKSLDTVTNFIVMARTSATMNKAAGRETLRAGKRGRAMPIKNIVKDGTTILGNLFTKRGWSHVTVQACKTHHKWAVSKHVKEFAGLPKQSKKPLPAPYQPLLRQFYAVLDSKDEADAYCQLAALQGMVHHVKGPEGKPLHTALRQVAASLPKILAHQRDPDLPATNNKLENNHQEFEYYPSFKRRMMTDAGNQRVGDYRWFRHNRRLFPPYIKRARRQYEQYRAFLTEFPSDPSLRGQGMYFKHLFLKLERWSGEYQRIWDDWFAKI